MVNDPDKIRRYIKDHEFSSIVPGLKWADLPAPPHELYDVMFEWHKEFHEKLAAGEMHGMIFADPLNMGGRARSKTAIEDLSSYLQDPTLETLEDRARMVFFHVSTASTSMVLNKKAWYREVVGLGTEYFQHMIDHELITPVIDGGQVYGEVSDALLGNREPVICALGDDWNIAKEGELVAYDGNNWESFTPPILGEGFTPWMTPFGGQIHLPSGNYATSALDGLAMQCSNTRAPDSIVEYQEMDSKVQFVLGLRFVDDPIIPRFQGAKLTVDDARKSFDLKSGDTARLRGKHSSQEIARWTDGYRGVFADGRTLLELMTDVSADRDYIDPSEILEEIVLD